MTDTSDEITRLETHLLPLKHRRILERLAEKDDSVRVSDWHYAMAWALLEMLNT